ncbi:pilin N-terminal domain-containing protein [Enterococcus gilvus]|uniref:pilin N-terminal domain-containing protein n=1 Tax=Enterococcus gilvus TaxID=160453 RepID=UPI0028D76058|nr:SpaA isopeptide-forming pilin-related protein [Enterococcus gilvus]
MKFLRQHLVIIALLAFLGIFSGVSQSSIVRADDTQDTPPEKVTISVSKLMYDKDFAFNPDIDGIKNDGYSHDLPKGISPFNKTDYGDVSFTLCNITAQVLPTPDSEITNQVIDKIVKDVQDNGDQSTYVKQASEKTTQAVDNTGIATFSNQDAYVNGNYTVYLLYESQSANGLIAQKAKPMIVTAPMTDNMGEKYLTTIHLYPKNIVQKLTFDFSKFGDDGTVKMLKTPLNEAKFTLYKGNAGSGTKLGDATTDKNGKLSVDSLTVGSYYLVENPSNLVPDPSKTPTDKQYLLGADARNNANNKLQFTVTPAGVRQQMTGSFVNYKAPTVKKVVLNGTGKDHSFKIGDMVNYEGTLHLPNDVGGGTNGITINGKNTDTSPYSELKWKDTASKGLSYFPKQANLSVTSGDGKTKLAPEKDYKLTEATNGFTLDFIVNNGKVSDTVKALHGQDVKIDYSMVVNDQATIGEALPNNVDVTYNNDPVDPSHHDVPDHADVFTYGATFIKEDSGFFGTGISKTPLQGAEFVVKNTDGNFYAGLQDSDGSGVKKATWVSDQKDAVKLISGKDGQFQVTGFAEGNYQLLETKAPNGYQKALKPTDFVVNANSYKKGNQIVIKNNQKSVMPNTGSQRLVLFGAIVLVLLFAAVVTVIIRHRRMQETQ